MITWRIIPISKWLITMVRKSPTWGYCPSKSPKWLLSGGYYLLTNWDDPPSMVHVNLPGCITALCTRTEFWPSLPWPALLEKVRPLNLEPISPLFWVEGWVEASKSRLELSAKEMVIWVPGIYIYVLLKIYKICFYIHII